MILAMGLIIYISILIAWVGEGEKKCKYFDPQRKKIPRKK